MSRRPQSADAQLKKIADKLQYFQSSKEARDLTGREMWELWEMFRVLTLRIRDLENDLSLSSALPLKDFLQRKKSASAARPTSAPSRPATSAEPSQPTAILSSGVERSDKQ